MCVLERHDRRLHKVCVVVKLSPGNVKAVCPTLASRGSNGVSGEVGWRMKGEAQNLSGGSVGVLWPIDLTGPHSV